MSWFFSHQQRRKRLENAQDFFVKTKIKAKTFISKPRPRPRLVFVLDAPRDQDLGLEDYITGMNMYEIQAGRRLAWSRGLHHWYEYVWDSSGQTSFTAAISECGLRTTKQTREGIVGHFEVIMRIMTQTHRITYLSTYVYCWCHCYCELYWCILQLRFYFKNSFCPQYAVYPSQTESWLSLGRSEFRLVDQTLTWK